MNIIIEMNDIFHMSTLLHMSTYSFPTVTTLTYYIHSIKQAINVGKGLILCEGGANSTQLIFMRL